MNYTNIITETKSNIGHITINRPKQLNALNKKTIEELNHAIIDFDKYDATILSTGSEVEIVLTFINLTRLIRSCTSTLVSVN